MYRSLQRAARPPLSRDEDALVPGPNDDVEAADHDGGFPRWVRVSAVVAAIVIATLVLVAVLAGPGQHGPGRHVPQGSEVDEPAGALAVAELR